MTSSSESGLYPRVHFWDFHLGQEPWTKSFGTPVQARIRTHWISFGPTDSLYIPMTPKADHYAKTDHHPGFIQRRWRGRVWRSHGSPWRDWKTSTHRSAADHRYVQDATLQGKKCWARLRDWCCSTTSSWMCQRLGSLGWTRPFFQQERYRLSIRCLSGYEDVRRDFELAASHGPSRSSR